MTGNPIWLDRAGSLTQHVWSHYRASAGGLADTPGALDGEGYLSEPFIPVQDSPTPSPNGVAGTVLCRLAEHTGDDRWRAQARELLEAFAGEAGQLGVFGATLLGAIDWAVNLPTHVVVVAKGEDRTALVRAAKATYRPRKVITVLDPEARVPERLPPALAAMIDGNHPRAYVCTGFECAPPAESPEALSRNLVTFGVRR